MTTIKSTINRTINYLHSIFDPIWYSFFGHKFHIIKTGLTPSPWYDADTRILYGVMSCVKWYVENDMREPWTEESINKEIEEMSETSTPEFCEETRKRLLEALETDRIAIEIAKWWDNYPLREKEVDDEPNFRISRELERKLMEEEQDMLMKAIKYRSTMWS